MALKFALLALISGTRMPPKAICFILCQAIIRGQLPPQFRERIILYLTPEYSLYLAGIFRWIFTWTLTPSLRSLGSLADLSGLLKGAGKFTQIFSLEKLLAIQSRNLIWELDKTELGTNILKTNMGKTVRRENWKL